MMNAAMRIRIEDWNRFQEFCERNRYTVREGFQELVKNLTKA